MSNIYISRIAKKLERDISRVFSTFCLFLQSKKKSRPFSSFFIWSFWVDSCQIKAGIPIFSPLNWQLSKMTGNCEQWIVTLIYSCSYVGTLCVPAMFQDVGRLRRDLTVNNGTLAMVFRLFLNQEVYVHFLQRRGENSPILAFSTSRALRRLTQSTENEWLPNRFAQ